MKNTWSNFFIIVGFLACVGQNWFGFWIIAIGLAIRN